MVVEQRCKSSTQAEDDEYSMKRRQAKRIVAIARTEQGTQELYDELESNEGEKSIYRIAKARQREREEFGNIDIIKDKKGKMLFDEGKISSRWADYLEELLNVENKGKR